MKPQTLEPVDSHTKYKGFIALIVLFQDRMLVKFNTQQMNLQRKELRIYAQNSFVPLTR